MNILFGERIPYGRLYVRCVVITLPSLGTVVTDESFSGNFVDGDDTEGDDDNDQDQGDDQNDDNNFD